MEQIKEFFSALFSQLGSVTESVGFAEGYNAVARFVFPVLAFLIVYRCAKSLLSFRKEPEIWAWLCLPDGTRLPVTHWENIIGRSKRSDLVIDVPTISRSHAVLTRYDDGSWSISDVGSRGGVFVNGARTNMAAITINDTLSLGGIEMYLEPITHRQEVIQASSRTKAGRVITPGATLFLLTLLQALVLLQLLLQSDAEYLRSVFISFVGLAAVEWILFFVTRLMRRSGFEMETLAFFLSTVGMTVITSKIHSELISSTATIKQLVALVLGIILYVAIIWSLRDLERAKKIRYLAAAAGIGLLLINIALGVVKYGAMNWIEIGGISFQPSELVKVCFIFAGASTMDRIVAKRNLILFIGYSAVICGCLAWMSDFGTALIFFVCFLVIAYLRSGSFAGIALICAGTGFAGVLAAKFRPYILERFSTWGHVWDDPLGSGFQQTRSLMCIASGGLVGLGLGRGPGVCFCLGGMGPAGGGHDGGCACNHGRIRFEGGVHGAEQLLYHRRLRGNEHYDHADHPQRLRNGGPAAADRRDLPVRIQRRLEHDGFLGPAGFHQGRGYPPERQRCRQAAVQKGGAG